ncbi:uncharacterized protein EKO05_0001297 [Ascochyta rabiei]|uniref:Uncharacterized protein n=1 Tax=Didymella rabiei TaxID=5454 RepID=A0A163D3X6_DIDRA|nr:uncharacterized protein EKO05_0001297 [Ascochyta rabiei]KZM22891.1 hypothetical protein ST47_g5994 [Ascochyta rabiei]UPX10652.1 hypothetical protein EKO05_0001297 [Ascochyta rabiei]
MFVSVKERARQIANGQFSAAPTGAPVASLIDLTPEPKPGSVATAKKSSSKDTPANAQASSSKTKSSKTAPTKEPTLQVATPKATPPPTTVLTTTLLNPTLPNLTLPRTTLPRTTSPAKASTPKKPSSKTKATKEPTSKPSSPKIGSPKPTSSSQAASQAKAPSTPKLTSSPKPAVAAKPASAKTPSTPPQSKRSKSPPKRVDSPISDPDADALTMLKSACLKQVSGVTGLGGRRLTVVPKQRSSGAWYVALKDATSDRYLTMWTHRDKTFDTPEEALEAYLAFAIRMRDGVRWFPVGARAGSPKGKGR